LTKRKPALSPTDFLNALAQKFSDPSREAGREIKVGLDLGTASLVLVVLSGDGHPLAVAREEASVVRDGLVLDFSGAKQICEKLRLRLEQTLSVQLNRTAIAVPSGTSVRDAATHRYVAEAAGLEVEAILDEPVAANSLLGITDGALADLGGGTTGAAAFSRGELILSFDEPTGGHHLSLVLAGHLNLPLEEAEAFKINPQNASTVAPIVAPVLSKMGSILQNGLKYLTIKELWLAGGTAATPGAQGVISRETGYDVKIPVHPDLVTPAGIALGCSAYQALPLN
jgi:ethanolamine utilization protein EutJ